MMDPSRMCVPPNEVNRNVENWVLKHFGAGSKYRNMKDECPIAKSNNEYHKRHYFKERLSVILHDLTLDKIPTCLSQLKAIDMNKENSGLFFDFILDSIYANPNCVIPYARLCYEIVKQDPEVKQILCKKCQLAFEKKSIAHTERRIKVLEIQRCTEPFKVTRLKLELEKYDNCLRLKYISLIHFIGEVYLRQLLSKNTVVNFIHMLLSRKDDENLECACILLRLIGEKLEATGFDLQQIFYIMQTVIENGKISCKVWNMVNSLSDLRKSGWVENKTVSV